MAAALSWTDRTASDADSVVAVAATSGAFTALTIDAAYPAANALTNDPSKVTQVDYTTPAGGPFVLSVESNWTSDATVRVVAALNLRLPSTAVGVSFAVLSAAGATLETTTQVTLANLVPIPGTTDRYNAFAILTADRSANRLRLLVQVAASGTDYVEVGKLWAGPAIVWGGIGAEWEMGFVDPSTVARSRGGALAATRLPVRRTLSLTKRGLSYADALGTAGSASTLSLRQALQDAGISAPVVAISSNADTHRLQVGSLFGAITEMPSINHIGAARFGTALRIEEIR